MIGQVARLAADRATEWGLRTGDGIGTDLAGPLGMWQRRGRKGGSVAGERILVVDDEPTVREVVQHYLEREGYRVQAAEDGPSALAAFSADVPDLIVLDLMLPGVDGLEVCRQVRAKDSTPIIMLTAKGHESDRIVGLELGADDYVVKPFSPRELVARVRSVLRRTLAGDGQRDRAAAHRGRDRRPGHPRGDRRRPAGRPHRARVRPAGLPGRPSTPGVQPRPAAAPGLGVQPG